MGIKTISDLLLTTQGFTQNSFTGGEKTTAYSVHELTKAGTNLHNPTHFVVSSEQCCNMVGEGVKNGMNKIQGAKKQAK